MRILMIGSDRSYFSKHPIGDAISRHTKYAQLAGHLDIIVVGRGDSTEKTISPHLKVFLTNTPKILHLWGVLKVAKRLFKEHRYNLIVVQDLSAPAGEILKDRYRVPLIVGIH